MAWFAILIPIQRNAAGGYNTVSHRKNFVPVVCLALISHGPFPFAGENSKRPVPPYAATPETRHSFLPLARSRLLLPGSGRSLRSVSGRAGASALRALFSARPASGHPPATDAARWGASRRPFLCGQSTACVWWPCLLAFLSGDCGILDRIIAI